MQYLRKPYRLPIETVYIFHPPKLLFHHKSVTGQPEQVQPSNGVFFPSETNVVTIYYLFFV